MGSFTRSGVARPLAARSTSRLLLPLSLTYQEGVRATCRAQTHLTSSTPRIGQREGKAMETRTGVAPRPAHSQPLPQRLPDADITCFSLTDDRQEAKAFPRRHRAATSRRASLLPLHPRDKPLRPISPSTGREPPPGHCRPALPADAALPAPSPLPARRPAQLQPRSLARPGSAPDTCGLSCRASSRRSLSTAGILALRRGWVQGGWAPGLAAASLPTEAAAAVRLSVRLSVRPSAGCGARRLAALAGPEPEPLTPPSSRPWEEASHGAGLAGGGFLPPLTPRGPAGCVECGAEAPRRRVPLPLRPSCPAHGPGPHTARRECGSSPQLREMDPGCEGAGLRWK